MDYSFSLNKTRLIMVIVGFFLLGSLLFSAGLLAGLYINLPTTTNIASTSISTPAPIVINLPTPTPNSDGKTNSNEDKNKSVDSTETKNANTETKKSDENTNDSKTKKVVEKGKAFAVQVGNFTSLPEAQLLVHQLELKGYIPRISTIYDAERRARYVVLLGSYLYESDAKKSASIFSEQERVQAEAMLMNLF